MSHFNLNTKNKLLSIHHHLITLVVHSKLLLFPTLLNFLRVDFSFKLNCLRQTLLLVQSVNITCKTRFLCMHFLFVCGISQQETKTTLYNISISELLCNPRVKQIPCLFASISNCCHFIQKCIIYENTEMVMYA